MRPDGVSVCGLLTEDPPRTEPAILAGPGNGALREGVVAFPGARLEPMFERALTDVLVRMDEFAPDARASLLAATAVEFLDAGEKKRCELAGAFLTDEAPGALLVELKLSRDGLTGIFPVIKLACRKEASLTPRWCPGTASRPNLFPSMELMPERTRWFLNASFRFEY